MTKNKTPEHNNSDNNEIADEFDGLLQELEKQKKIQVIKDKKNSVIKDKKNSSKIVVELSLKDALKILKKEKFRESLDNLVIHFNKLKENYQEMENNEAKERLYEHIKNLKEEYKDSKAILEIVSKIKKFYKDEYIKKSNNPFIENEQKSFLYHLSNMQIKISDHNKSNVSFTFIPETQNNNIVRNKEMEKIYTGHVKLFNDLIYGNIKYKLPNELILKEAYNICNKEKALKYLIETKGEEDFTKDYIDIIRENMDNEEKINSVRTSFASILTDYDIQLNEKNKQVKTNIILDKQQHKKQVKQRDNNIAINDSSNVVSLRTKYQELSFKKQFEKGGPELRQEFEQDPELKSLEEKIKVILEINQKLQEYLKLKNPNIDEMKSVLEKIMRPYLRKYHSDKNLDNQEYVNKIFILINTYKEEVQKLLQSLNHTKANYSKEFQRQLFYADNTYNEFLEICYRAFYARKTAAEMKELWEQKIEISDKILDLMDEEDLKEDEIDQLKSEGKITAEEATKLKEKNEVEYYALKQKYWEKREELSLKIEALDLEYKEIRRIIDGEPSQSSMVDNDPKKAIEGVIEENKDLLTIDNEDKYFDIRTNNKIHKFFTTLKQEFTRRQERYFILSEYIDPGEKLSAEYRLEIKAYMDELLLQVQDVNLKAFIKTVANLYNKHYIEGKTNDTDDEFLFKTHGSFFSKKQYSFDVYLKDIEKLLANKMIIVGALSAKGFMYEFLYNTIAELKNDNIIYINKTQSRNDAIIKTSYSDLLSILQNKAMIGKILTDLNNKFEDFLVLRTYDSNYRNEMYGCLNKLMLDNKANPSISLLLNEMLRYHKDHFVNEKQYDDRIPRKNDDYFFQHFRNYLENLTFTSDINFETSNERNVETLWFYEGTSTITINHEKWIDKSKKIQLEESEEKNNNHFTEQIAQERNNPNENYRNL